MECKLVWAVDLPSNALFVGEMAGVHIEEQYPSSVRKRDLCLNSFRSSAEVCATILSIGNAFQNVILSISCQI